MMTRTRLFVLFSVSIFLLSISTLVFAFQNSVTPPDKTGEKGYLEGIVHFIGAPCSSGGKVPPCDGPYPGCEVIVYKTDGKTIVAKTTTDGNGHYALTLCPGQYVIYTQSGIHRDNLKANSFTIENGKTTILDLIIDTGIR